MKFKAGDLVTKASGEYQLDGEVVAAFKTKSGKDRYVVEHAPLAPGLLHIYSEANLSPREETSTPSHHG